MQELHGDRHGQGQRCHHRCVPLPPSCLGVEITSAKYSAINVNVPVDASAEDGGVFPKAPVPEMFKTVVRDGKLATSVVEHALGLSICDQTFFLLFERHAVAATHGTPLEYRQWSLHFDPAYFN